MTFQIRKAVPSEPNPLHVKPPPALKLTPIQEAIGTETDANAQFFTSNVTFTIPLNDKPVETCTAQLFARLLAHDRTLQLLPTADNSTLNPITSEKNIPTDDTGFSQYFSGLTTNRRSTQFYGTIVSTKRINEIKHAKGMFEYLRKWGIFMKYNQLKSTSVTSVGWLYDKHPEAESRNEIKTILSSMLEGFDSFQLNARDVALKRGSPIRTRAWVLEMDKDDAKAKFDMILEKCHLQARLTIVPFLDPQLWAQTDAIAETFFIKHNLMLRDSQVISVNGLRNLETFVDNDDETQITFRELLLRQTPIDHPNQQLFSSVSQVNSKRVCFLTTKDLYHSAVELVDEMLSTYIPSCAVDIVQTITFEDNPPVRVGKRAIPTTIKTYSSYLQDFAHDLDDDSRTSLTAPPTHRIRGQRTYLQATQPSSTPKQAPTTTTQATSAQSTTSSRSSLTEFETKLQTALDRIVTLQANIDKRQESYTIEKVAAATRMEKMESTVLQFLTSVETLTKQQSDLQKEVHDTNLKIDKVTTLMQHIFQQQMQPQPPGSPYRKIARFNNEDGMQLDTNGMQIDDSKLDFDMIAGTQDESPLTEGTTPSPNGTPGEIDPDTKSCS